MYSFGCSRGQSLDKSKFLGMKRVCNCSVEACLCCSVLNVFVRWQMSSNEDGSRGYDPNVCWEFMHPDFQRGNRGHMSLEDKEMPSVTSEPNSNSSSPSFEECEQNNDQNEMHTCIYWVLSLSQRNKRLITYQQLAMLYHMYPAKRFITAVFTFYDPCA